MPFYPFHCLEGILWKIACPVCGDLRIWIGEGNIYHCHGCDSWWHKLGPGLWVARPWLKKEPLFIL